MKIKMYTQPNCLFCKNVKDTLTENEIEYKEIDISTTENREEWNLVTRISGLGLTPTITFNDQVWAPNRDFQDEKSLVQRLKYFLDNPLSPPSDEEKFQILLNATKNLAMSLQNIHQLLANIHGKVNQLTTQPEDIPPTIPNQPESETKESDSKEKTTTS